MAKPKKGKPDQRRSLHDVAEDISFSHGSNNIWGKEVKRRVPELTRLAKSDLDARRLLWFFSHVVKDEGLAPKHVPRFISKLKHDRLYGKTMEELEKYERLIADSKAKEQKRMENLMTENSVRMNQGMAKLFRARDSTNVAELRRKILGVEERQH